MIKLRTLKRENCWFILRLFFKEFILLVWSNINSTSINFDAEFLLILNLNSDLSEFFIGIILMLAHWAFSAITATTVEILGSVGLFEIELLKSIVFVRSEYSIFQSRVNTSYIEQIVLMPFILLVFSILDVWVSNGFLYFNILIHIAYF